MCKVVVGIFMFIGWALCIIFAILFGICDQDKQNTNGPRPEPEPGPIPDPEPFKCPECKTCPIQEPCLECICIDENIARYPQCQLTLDERSKEYRQITEDYSRLIQIENMKIDQFKYTLYTPEQILSSYYDWLEIQLLSFYKAHYQLILFIMNPQDANTQRNFNKVMKLERAVQGISIFACIEGWYDPGCLSLDLSDLEIQNYLKILRICNKLLNILQFKLQFKQFLMVNLIQNQKINFTQGISRNYKKF